MIDSNCTIAIARLNEIIARLAAFEAAARPFEEAQAAIGPLLADMAAVARRITRWSQSILGASTALGCLWLAIYGPMSVMLARQYDRRYQALRRGVKAAQTLERRGELAVAAGGVVSAHISSDAVDSRSRPFKGLASHRQVVRTERLADLDRMATARRWLIVKTVTVLGVAVSFCVATCTHARVDSRSDVARLALRAVASSDHLGPADVLDHALRLPVWPSRPRCCRPVCL